MTETKCKPFASVLKAAAHGRPVAVSSTLTRGDHGYLACVRGSAAHMIDAAGNLWQCELINGSFLELKLIRAAEAAAE